MISNTKIKSYTGPRYDVIRMIEDEPKRVLDVGCSDGSIGAALKNIYRTVEVHGIEFDVKFAEKARLRLDSVTQADLNSFDLSTLPKNVDLFIFADVLEHTVHPKNVMKKIIEHCGDTNYKIIVSVPNVQHITVIFNLLAGHWPERDRGIFDHTHLRWFTYDSIVKLAAHSNLKITNVKRNYRFIDGPNWKLNRLARCFKYLPFRNFFTYQYVVVLEHVK